MREAPSIPLITALHDMGATVRAYDPVGMEQAQEACCPTSTYCDDPYDCAQGADALVIVTEWEQFRALDLDAAEERDGAAGRWSICATSTGPRRWRRTASSTRASAGASELAVRACRRHAYGLSRIASRPPTNAASPGQRDDEWRILPALRHPASDRRRARELTRALAASNAAVLVAPPGAGKTTRVPLALLDEPWAQDRKILVLEPRRLAARAAAERMATTLGEKRRRDRRPARALRLEGVARDAHRGRHRRHLHAADPRRSGARRRRRGAVRRISRALARCRSRPGAGARRAAGPARGSAHPGDVGDARRRAGGKAARRCAGDRERRPRLSGRDALSRPRSAMRRSSGRWRTRSRAALRADPGSVLAFLPGAAEIRRTETLLQRARRRSRGRHRRALRRARRATCRTAPSRRRRRAGARSCWRPRSPRPR